MNTTPVNAKLSVLMLLSMFVLSACSGGNGDNPDSGSAPTNPGPVNTDPNPVDSDPISENSAPFAQVTVQSVNPFFFPEDVVTLQGSGSSDFDGTIVSYQWTQLSGPSQVVLSSPDEADTTFIAPISLVSGTYVFQLEVVDDKGAADSATQSVIIEPSVKCTSCTPNQINTLYESGVIKGARYGQLAAIEGGVLAVANQVSNKIEFHDLASGAIQKEFQLNSAPDQLYFQSNRRLLYVSLVGATAIAQINIDSDQIQFFQISGMVESMTGGSERVYYSLQNQFRNNVLYSLGPDGNEQSHGSIDGNLVAYNANLNEIINAESDSSGGALHRYGFNESGQVDQIQTADPDSSGFFGPVPFANNISISSNGQQMAIASSGGGNGPATPILDIPPGNIQASNGAWLSSGAVAWVEFSATDKHIITVRFSFDVGAAVTTLYDSTSKVMLFEKTLPSCEDQFDSPVQTGFSDDNLYFYAKIACGFDGNESFISYTRLPGF